MALNLLNGSNLEQLALKGLMASVPRLTPHLVRPKYAVRAQNLITQTHKCHSIVCDSGDTGHHSEVCSRTFARWRRLHDFRATCELLPGETQALPTVARNSTIKVNRHGIMTEGGVARQSLYVSEN